MTDSGLHPVRSFRQSQVPVMTLGALAEKIGTTEANLSRIETGKQELTTTLAKKISDATGIPMRTLCPDLAKMFDAEAAQ